MLHQSQQHYWVRHQLKSEGSVNDWTLLSETGSDHLHVIAEEISRVGELCIGQDMGILSTATAFMDMEAGSVI
jgi:hypothetical protein